MTAVLHLEDCFLSIVTWKGICQLYSVSDKAWVP